MTLSRDNLNASPVDAPRLPSGDALGTYQQPEQCPRNTKPGSTEEDDLPVGPCQGAPRRAALPRCGIQECGLKCHV